MTSSQSSGPPFIAFKRPSCRRCHTRMSLARIAPGPTGYDLVTFECSKCEHVHKEAVANDPMKSDKVTGWLAGDLRPPE
jgi:hypothetical protein